jgi:hypothetical protein
MSKVDWSGKWTRNPALAAACLVVLVMGAGCTSVNSPEQVLAGPGTPVGTTDTGDQLVYTGAPQAVVVPAGVNSMKFTLFGASGGAGDSGPQGAYSGGRGGYGAAVSGSIAVTPGFTVTVAVGGQGGHYGTNPANNHGGWGQPSGGPGGVNPLNGEPFGGGGGGGATSMTINGVLIAVAGGGGGGGAGGVGPFTGVGGAGGTAGDPAQDGNRGHGAEYGDGGHAGTQISGIGAQGGVGDGGDSSPGGGGGGGVLGGQGGHGASGAGGGGGSGTSMTSGQVTSPAVAQDIALGPGQASITWNTGS